MKGVIVSNKQVSKALHEYVTENRKRNMRAEIVLDRYDGEVWCNACMVNNWFVYTDRDYYILSREFIDMSDAGMEINADNVTKVAQKIVDNYERED